MTKKPPRLPASACIMKLFPKVRLEVSKTLFRFSCGTAEFQFKPEVHLSADRIIQAIGSPPLQGAVAHVVCPLELPENLTENREIVEMLLRHGVRNVVGGWCLGPLTLEIICDPSAQIFSPEEWRGIGSQAGASKVIVQPSEA